MNQSEIANKTEYFCSVLNLRAEREAELISTGIPELDHLAGGLPRGGITEVIGSASSGRTSLLHSVMKTSTTGGELCALVDADDSFDPASATAAGVDLGRLLWIRCGANIERAMRATDILLHAGGFGLIALDLANMPLHQSRGIEASSWFRFQRAVEHKPTSLLVISRIPKTRSCASLVLELRRENAQWLTTNMKPPAQECALTTRVTLLGEFWFRVERRKPVSLNEKGTIKILAQANHQSMDSFFPGIEHKSTVDNFVDGDILKEQ